MKSSALISSSIFIVVYCMLCSTPGLADTPTAEEQCRKRNSASCEINGLRFFIEDDCPRGAKILRPKGKERCEDFADRVATNRNVSVEGTETQVAAQKAEPTPINPGNNAAGGMLENPLIVVAVLGLLQGFISRVGWRSFIIVATVIPVIVTWSVVTDTAIKLAGEAYWGFVVWSLLKILSCSMLGWGAGLAAHRGLLKLLHR